MLERGDYVPREKDNWESRAVNIESKYQTKEKWRDGQGNDLHPHTNYNVGGNTKFYGSALFRLRKEDYSSEERAEISTRVHRLLADGRDVYVFFKHEDTPAGALYAEDLLKAK